MYGTVDVTGSPFLLVQFETIVSGSPTSRSVALNFSAYSIDDKHAVDTRVVVSNIGDVGPLVATMTFKDAEGKVLATPDITVPQGGVRTKLASQMSA